MSGNWNEYRKGSRKVISIKDGEWWHSRLYVNYGDTPTQTHAQHKTSAGVERWAKKVLGL